MTKISIEIPEEWVERKKKCGRQWENIIGLGLQSAEENPGFIKRLTHLEKEVEILKRLVLKR